MTRILVLAAALLLTAACAADPGAMIEPQPNRALADVRPEVDQSFRLAIGEVASVEGGALFVTFAGASNDSRCPVDVNCVWAGDAELTIGLALMDEAWNRPTLHTHLDPRSASLGPFTITVEGLEPAPRSTGRIDPARYVAVLRVTRE